MKTNNETLKEIWDDLSDIFENFKKFDYKIQNRLQKLGFEVVYTGKHPKMYFYIDNIRYCITLCSTPSDKYAGRQILRQIRRYYEIH